MLRCLLALAVFSGLCLTAQPAQAFQSAPEKGFFGRVAAKVGEKPEVKLPAGVPKKVGMVLQYIDANGKAIEGFEGGRNFLNIEKLLPMKDAKGKPVKYREWDVNPLKPGVNRGAERLVTGSDGSAYYTDDHYKSFTKIR